MRELRITAALMAIVAAIAVLGPAKAEAAPIGTTAIWEFNLPSTAVASQTPPYPLVATLTLTQTAAGVQFLLDPAELAPGTGYEAQSFVERLDIVYDGPSLEATDGDCLSTNAAAGECRNDDPITNDPFGGGPISGYNYLTTPGPDSGYFADAEHIAFDFPSGRGQGDESDRLNAFSETRTWTILGALLEQFDDSFATSGPKPSPIYGVISVTAYSLTDVTPTPSNWVACTPACDDDVDDLTNTVDIVDFQDDVPTPEPGTLLLLGLALGVGARRAQRRSRKN